MTRFTLVQTNLSGGRRDVKQCHRDCAVQSRNWVRGVHFRKLHGKGKLNADEFPSYFCQTRRSMNFGALLLSTGVVERKVFAG